MHTDGRTDIAILTGTSQGMLARLKCLTAENLVPVVEIMFSLGYENISPGIWWYKIFLARSCTRPGEIYEKQTYSFCIHSLAGVLTIQHSNRF
jgi:hypothetical protein